MIGRGQPRRGPAGMTTGSETMGDAARYDCQSCGACCAYSSECPVFEWDLSDRDGIPEEMIDDDGKGMRCYNDQCCALNGVIGFSTWCAIYERRPVACRSLQAGSEGCRMIRRYFGLESL